MNFKKVKPQFSKQINPRVGLIVLSTDIMIEKDFFKVFGGKSIDLYINRIKNYNPVTAKNLNKMTKNITSVTKNILPGEKIDCVVYGCTSGTIVSGFKNIKKKINLAKPNALVLNDDVVNFFKENNFIITSNTYFDIKSDVDIGKVDQDNLFRLLSNINHNKAEALFVSCTSLPVLNIIEKLEKKLKMVVLSSNQALIWETLEKINKNVSVRGFGSLFK